MFLGSGPEGADDLCFVNLRDVDLRAGIWPSKLEFSFKAGILNINLYADFL